MTRPPDGRPERSLWGPDVPRDVDDELADHLAEREAELRAEGLDPEAARARAREKFGDVGAVRRALVTMDESRERVRRRHDYLGDLGRDLRLAVRSLRRSPGFAITAFVTIALGIGATTAVFSIVDATALRPLPYPDPTRLALAVRQMPRDGGKTTACSFQDYVDWSERTDLFERTAAAVRSGFMIDGPAGLEWIWSGRVSSSFFSVLGVRPVLGRDLTDEDSRYGAARVAVVSHDFWRGRLGGDPDLSRHDVELSGQAHRVVGVLPASFRSMLHLPGAADVWVPLVVEPQTNKTRDARWLTFVARIRADVPLDRARAVIETMSRQAYADRSDETLRRGFTLVSAGDFVSGAFRPALFTLLAAVSCMLLIACANVANLLVARSLARRREMAIRVAIGAGRARLVRQQLTESLLLGLAGGAAGLAVAWLILPTILRLSPATLPRLDEAGIDLRVLSFVLLVSIATSLLFGGFPALRASRREPSDVLGTSGGAAGGRDGLARRALMGTEVAVTVVLLAGAALLVTSFEKLVRVDPGFTVDRVATVKVVPSAKDRAVPLYFDDLLARVEALPQVEAAGLVDILPLLPAWANADVTARELAEDARPDIADEPVHYEIRTATGGYFEALRIPLLRGRAFTDVDAATPAAIVSDDLARRIWGNADPIGKRLHVGPPEQPWVPVVGVVGPVRHFGLDRDVDPMIYRAANPGASWPSTLVVRASGDPSAFAPALRSAILDLDRRALLTTIRSMEEVLIDSVAERRFYAFLLTSLGFIAAALAAAGLFGLVAYLVGERTREFGVCMALGAKPGRLLAGVVAGGLKVTAVGIVAGLAAALAATRLLTSLLFDLSPTDPWVLAGVAVLMLAIAGAACYVPARRVLRVDPVEALRAE